MRIIRRGARWGRERWEWRGDALLKEVPYWRRLEEEAWRCDAVIGGLLGTCWDRSRGRGRETVFRND